MKPILGTDWDKCLDLLHQWDIEEGSPLNGVAVLNKKSLLYPAVRVTWHSKEQGYWLTGHPACSNYKDAMTILGELIDALNHRYEIYRKELDAICATLNESPVFS